MPVSAQKRVAAHVVGRHTLKHEVQRHVVRFLLHSTNVKTKLLHLPVLPLEKSCKEHDDIAPTVLGFPTTQAYIFADERAQAQLPAPALGEQ